MAGFMPRELWLVGLACILLMGAGIPARAAGFNIQPVRVDLSAETRVQVVEFTNRGRSAATFEARVFDWQQPAGEDKLSPTRALIVSPAVFRLQPGATQLIRVGLLELSHQGGEAAYRLLLEEVLASGNAPAQGLRIALNFSIPIFVRAGQQTPAALSGHIEPLGGQSALILRNTGGQHIRLQEIALLTPGASRRLLFSGNAYVLPGQTRRWPLPEGMSTGYSGVEILSDGQSLRMPLAAKSP